MCPHLPIQINSPDIDGDGDVDLSDVAIFAGDFFGAYAFRSDFVWDGQMNLSDVAVLSQGIAANCP